MPLDVICPWCRDCFFETNDSNNYIDDPRGILFRNFKEDLRVSDFVQRYDPKRSANAAMIRLKDDLKEYIDDIQHDCDLLSEAIGPCPGCGNPLSNDNYTFIIRPQKVIPTTYGEITTNDTAEMKEWKADVDAKKCRYCGEHFPTSKGRIIHEKRWCSKRPQAE